MIYIPQPSIALNTSDFPPMEHYRMASSLIVPRTWSIQRIADETAAACASHGGSVECLVFNSHGSDMCGGRLAIGTGLSMGSWQPLAALEGKIRRKIFLVACQVAETPQGRTLCATLAREIGVPVVASKHPQGAGISDRVLCFNSDGMCIAANYIDDFEGSTMVFFPDGGFSRYVG